MTDIRISRNPYAAFFGGLGFHNNDATMYHVMDKEHFNQIICKNYREISPGFMRTFGGFSDWTKEAMDEFAEYYTQMQKWTDTPMYLTPAAGKLHFSDGEMRKYAEDVADRLAYLYFEKDVRHLRYYCFSNEMSRVMWGVLMDDLETFKKYHTYLYDAFQRHGLPIGLLATDASEYENWSTVDWAIENMADISEDYCVHIYERGHDIRDLSFYGFFREQCEKIVGKAIQNFGKRVILGEVGIQKSAGQLSFNGGAVIDTNRYFEDPEECAFSALMLCEMAFAAINAGIFALCYWSFCDHPAPFSCAYSNKHGGYAEKWSEAERFFSCTADTKYNKFGFTKWDDFTKDYGARAHYYGVAPMIKLFKRNSYVLDVTSCDALLRTCGLLNRDGSLSVGVVNRRKEPVTVRLESTLLGAKPVRVYEYDPQNVPFNRFCDLPDFTAVLAPDAAIYELKPESVTFFTTDYLEKTHTVSAFGPTVSAHTLTWEPVSDPNHCYYRIFADKKADFAPSRENQIASTIACRLPLEVKTEGLHYKVLSVDKSGNI